MSALLPTWRRRLLMLVAAGCAVAAASAAPSDPFADLRREMVSRQLQERRIEDRRLLEVMSEVPRHLFVPQPLRDKAYDDQALAIGEGRSIHQPYLVARMTELLELDRGAKVLEIGTGTGYHTAVLSKLARQVFTIEIDPESARRARQALDELGARNVHFRIGDGYQGWPQEAPFDAIILTAAPPYIPEPLLRQLKIGGKMVVPVGSVVQDLLVLTKTEHGYEKRAMFPVNIPPMSGEVEGKP